MVNDNNSQTWIKAIWGWFLSSIMIPVRENSEGYLKGDVQDPQVIEN